MPTPLTALSTDECHGLRGGPQGRWSAGVQEERGGEGLTTRQAGAWPGQEPEAMARLRHHVHLIVTVLTEYIDLLNFFV